MEKINSFSENQEVLKLYHGSTEKTLIPKFGYGKTNNDYGQGFYTTQNKELAKEWAAGPYNAGGGKCYVHEFELNILNLKIFEFNEILVLNWIAELMKNRKINRTGNEIVEEKIKKFIRIYGLDLSSYDCIIGYRADDSYFSYMSDFVLDLLYLDSVKKAMTLGKLGKQFFVKSERAFNALKFIACEEVPEIYKKKYLHRDETARNLLSSVKRDNNLLYSKITISDLIGDK